METSGLPPNQRLAAPGKWPVVGEKAPRTNDDSSWTLCISGAVEVPFTLSLDELARDFPRVERTIDIHCVTRWSKLAAVFSGFALDEILARAKVLPGAKFVSFVARSDRNHSTSLPLDYLRETPCLIATHEGGEPLETMHGGPVRMVVPGRYFYKSVKWLETIEVLERDRPGFWEAESGYHNGADPWAEERYAAPNIEPKTLARALQTRDFRDLDLRGANLSSLDLSGLDARGALLRDVHFERANLSGADFTGANLSNAHLQDADCAAARFTDADLEGADFARANLTGADLTGASLFGTTFD